MNFNIELKASSVNQIKKVIVKLLDNLDREELTNLKWFLYSRNKISKIENLNNSNLINLLNNSILKSKNSKTNILEQKKTKNNKNIVNDFNVEIESDENKNKTIDNVVKRKRKRLDKIKKKPKQKDTN